MRTLSSCMNANLKVDAGRCHSVDEEHALRGLAWQASEIRRRLIAIAPDLLLKCKKKHSQWSA